MRKISCDWLSGSTDNVEVWNFLSRLTASSPQTLGKSRFYNQVTAGEGFTLSCQPRNKNLKKYMFEFSGKGCQTFNGLEMLWMCKDHCRFNRVDIAWDFFSAFGSMEPIIWSDDVIPGKKQPITKYEIDQEYTGFTSGKTEFRIRYYDKGREQGCIPNGSMEWWRLEVVVRGDLAKCQEWENPVGTALSLLKNRYQHPVFETLGEEIPVKAKPRSAAVDEDVKIFRIKENLRKGVNALAQAGVEVKIYEGDLKYEMAS